MVMALDMRNLKDKAVESPEPLRSLILSERDFMGVEDFVSKFASWERILKVLGGFS